jgi:hypothetical protein
VVGGVVNGYGAWVDQVGTVCPRELFHSKETHILTSFSTAPAACPPSSADLACSRCPSRSRAARCDTHTHTHNAHNTHTHNAHNTHTHTHTHTHTPHTHTHTHTHAK